MNAFCASSEMSTMPFVAIRTQCVCFVLDEHRQHNTQRPHAIKTNKLNLSKAIVLWVGVCYVPASLVLSEKCERTFFIIFRVPFLFLCTYFFANAWQSEGWMRMMSMKENILKCYN